MSLAAGTQVGRYTISRLLAQGGMAEVYRAEQVLAGGISRKVAVKVIRPEYSGSQDFRQMFLDEARTACTLSHPNIAHIYEVGEGDDGQLYMAMELVTGETLATVNRTLRTRGERFSDEALFAIGVQTCGALEAVHALRTEGGKVNLVHRDVSPHNLLLSVGGAVKLIDFGIAKAATNRNLTMPGVTKGKAGYFSPEQAMGKRLDGRSDLFSLGVTLYKLASGETPFDEHKTHGERHAALVRGQWKRLADVYPGLPKGFYAVVDKALAVAPDGRYQSARDMREALERAAFDARIRVGASTLVGYLDEEGEVTATGGARTAATAPAPKETLSEAELTRAPRGEADGEDEAPDDQDLTPDGDPTANHRLPSSPRAVVAPRVTASLATPVRLSKDPRGRAGPPRSLMLVLGVAAVAVGVFGTLLLRDSTSAPLEVAPPPPAPNEARPTPQPKPHPQEPTADIDLTSPAPEPLKHAPVPSPAPSPRPRPPVSKPVVAHPAERVDPPPAPEPQPIPAGEGKLRIKVDAPGRATVVVGGESWGEPPVDRRVASGNYRVVVKLDDGTSAAVQAVVLPDQITRLTYSTSSQKWVVQGP